mgnify:CR=1 FL=1
MATVKVYDQNKQECGELTLSADVFEVEARPEILNLVVRAQMAAKRAGTHMAKTRAFVSGGGVKPWKQKGTGRARSGSNRSPVWRGGAIVFGPQPRDYSFKLNKKLKQLARRSALTYKAQAGAICVVEPISMDAPKTKSIVAMAEALKVADKKVLLVLPDSNVNLQLSCRNLPYVKAILASNVNTYEVMNASALVMVEGAENILNTMLA